MGAAIQGVLMRMTVGAPPLWTRENWPRSGYYLELMDTRDVRALWQRHRQRVEQTVQATGARVRPHDDLRLFMCISRRGSDIIEHKGRWQGYFSALTIILVMACIVMTLAAFWIWNKVLSKAMEGLGRFGGLIAVVPVLVMLLVAILAFPLMGFFRAVVVPHLPGPRLQPVDELLRQVPPL
jgi:hypothetical protein